MKRKLLSISLLVMLMGLLVAPALVYADDPEPAQGCMASGEVWYDRDRDGVRTDAEHNMDWPGSAGIRVDFYANIECGGTPHASGFTDSDGEYCFNHGKDALTEFSNICLEFTGFPCPLILSPMDVGGNDHPSHHVDSDAEWVDGRLLIQQTRDYVRHTNDVGYVCGGFIGDTVCCDPDADNICDAGDEIAGATVELWKDDDCDGDHDTLLDTTTTNADGEYEFGPVPVAPPGGGPPECYVVMVDTTTLGQCYQGVYYSEVGLRANDPVDMGHDFLFKLVPEVVVEEGVPEAGTILLMGSGLMGLAGYARLRLRKR